jgi:hypothetical protein
MLAEPLRLHPEPAADLAHLDAAIHAADHAALDAYTVAAEIHAARACYLATLAREEVGALRAMTQDTLGDSYAHEVAADRARWRVRAIAQLAREVARCARAARRLDTERAVLAAKLG